MSGANGIVSIGFENGNLGMIMPQFKVKIQDPNTGKLQTFKIKAFIFHHIEKAYLAFLSLTSCKIKRNIFKKLFPLITLKIMKKF